jgi:apolipoprotein N-acyltransferase
MAITTTKLDSPADVPATPRSPAPVSQPGPALPAIGLGLLSGVLIILAYPPFNAWPLAFVAFVPMIVGQHRVASARWSGAVFGIGVGTMLAGAFSIGLYQDRVAPFFQVLPVYFAVIFTLAMWRSRRFHERTGYRWLWITSPLAWVAVDFGRNLGALSSLGGTWGNPVYTLFHAKTFLQPISVFGMYGLELLVLVVNYAVATAVIRRIDGRPLPARLLAGVMAAVLAWALLGAGLMGSGGRTVRVAAIQTGTAGFHGDAQMEQRLQRDIAQTRAAAAQGAKLAVWSEVGLPFDPTTSHTAQLQAVARDSNIAISIGYGYDDTKGRHHNEVRLLTPDGKFSEPYGKDHPGTFAGDYSDTGGTYPVTHTSFAAIGTVICYDMDFTDTARKMTRNGARLIAASSSDVFAIADTHYTHLIFRAIENRVATVKGDKGYDSTIIDPWGRVEKLTTDPSGRAQRTLVADVPLGSGKSPFVSLGDWIGWLALLATAGVVVGAKVTGRRRANAETPTA